MDEQPRDPSPDPKPTEPAAPVTPDAPVTPAAEPTEPATGWIPPTRDLEPTVGWIPPAEGKPSRILIRVAAGIAVAVLGAVVFAMFIGGSSDPHDQALEEFGARLAALPEFKARYGDVETGDCAAIMRATISGTDAAAVVRRLEIDEFREMLDVTYTALVSELKGTPGPPAPTNADVDAASLALEGALGADRVVELGTTLADPSAADAAVCGAARSFVGGILALEEPHRTTFLRFMVAQGL